MLLVLDDVLLVEGVNETRLGVEEAIDFLRGDWQTDAYRWFFFLVSLLN